MKTVSIMKQSKNNGYQSDDDNVRYKINTEYFNNYKSPSKLKKVEKDQDDEDNIRYKLASALTKSKVETKPKPKNKIKVNFWSNKQSSSRLHNTELNKSKSSRRHTVGVIEEAVKPKAKPSPVKVRKRVSFLPSPLFLDNHIPMVTVPDDLTIQLNEEEANDLGADLNEAFVNSDSSGGKNDGQKRMPRSSLTQTSSTSSKRKRSFEGSDGRRHGDNELEFFSKYIVQKLRRMETNQRIYSENLINTVLMLGQLGKLNGKSKINEA